MSDYYGQHIGTIFGCLVPGLILAYYDIRERRLPNIINLTIFSTALLYAIEYHRLDDCLAGSLIGFTVLLITALMGGVGGGDVKLGASLGAWLGIKGILIILIIGPLMSSIWSFCHIYRKGRHQEIRQYCHGLWHAVIYGNKALINFKKLPEQGIHPDAAPLGAFLILSTWLYFGAGSILV